MPIGPPVRTGPHSLRFDVGGIVQQRPELSWTQVKVSVSKRHGEWLTHYRVLVPLSIGGLNFARASVSRPKIGAALIAGETGRNNDGPS